MPPGFARPPAPEHNVWATCIKIRPAGNCASGADATGPSPLRRSRAARAQPPSPLLRPSRSTPGTPALALSQLARAHAHETLVWAGKGGARHTFNYEAVNSRDPAGQVGSVWRIPPPPRREKTYGRHRPRSRCASCAGRCWPARGRGTSSSTRSAAPARRRWRPRSSTARSSGRN